MPAGWRSYSPFPFAGMNTNGSPTSISDQEFVWLENFVRLGDGKLRTAWDAGAALYQAGSKKVISFFPYSIGLNYYFAVFLNDGSAVQVRWPDGAITQIGPANTFYKATSGFIPGCVQWGVQYLLISNRNSVNDYWAWDGSLLYGAGTAAPNGVNLTSGGTNYDTPPTVNPFGGHGSGIVLSAVVNDGSVVNVEITNPGSGYEVGDVVQGQFVGGGSDRGPIITASLNAGGVAAANITDPGTGYTTASVVFSGGGGSGAAGTAIIGDGVSSINITNPGTGYSGATVVISGGGGTGAAADAIVVGGQVVEIDVTDPGTGYTGTPTVTINGDGSGAAANAVVDAGEITGISITSPGTGYTSAPSIAISGDGSGALAVATLGSSQLSKLTVVDPGSGFISAPLIVMEGGGGTGAAGFTTIGPTSVAKVNVVTPGMNYQKAPSVVFAGGPLDVGSAKVNVIMNGNGGVGQIEVTNGGSGYGVEPGVLIIPQKNDTGTGATAVAILAPHVLHQALISNFGLHYTDAPAVVVQPGANDAAYATIDLMPFGFSGSAIESFQQRVWLAVPADSPFDTLPPQGDWLVTAPGSIIDAATSDGGVLFTNSDAFLQTTYVAIRQSNGYLYFIGDGSVSVVSGVQTSVSGNPATASTTFNYQTVDPQVGGSWRDAVEDFGRQIIIANEIGIFAINGGTAQKISDKMDDVFLNASFPPSNNAVTPSSACAHLFAVKHFMMLATVKDPDTGLMRKVLLTWNGQLWSILSQSVDLTYIATQKRGSVLYAWGTDGSAIYPLFAAPSATLQKRLDTKYFGASNPIVEKDIQGFYIQAQDQSAGGAGVEGAVSFNVSGLASQEAQFPSVQSQIYTDAYVLEESQGLMGVLLQQPDFPAPYPSWPLFGTQTAGIPAMNVGARFTTTSPDFILSHLLLAYTEGPPAA